MILNITTFDITQWTNQGGEGGNKAKRRAVTQNFQDRIFDKIYQNLVVKYPLFDFIHLYTTFRTYLQPTNMLFVQMEDSEPQTNLDNLNSDLTF